MDRARRAAREDIALTGPLGARTGTAPFVASSDRGALGVRIRKYAPEDFVPVRRLWRRTGLGVGPSDSREELERARRRDPDLFLVASQGDRVVGAVLGRFDGRRGWINHLAVEPALQHRGIGGRLVEEVERRLARKGCRKVNLHVEPQNLRVGGFYERLGYRARDLLMMEKWLSGALLTQTAPAPPKPRPSRLR